MHILEVYLIAVCVVVVCVISCVIDKFVCFTYLYGNIYACHQRWWGRGPPLFHWFPLTYSIHNYTTVIIGMHHPGSDGIEF